VRVAIYPGDVDPAAGGAHTLSTDVVRALGRAALRGTPQGHELVVYTRGDAFAEADGGGLRIVRIDDRPFGDVVYDLMRGVRAVSELAGETFARLARGSWQTRLEAEGVGLIWSPSPRVPTLDVPFAVTVWDLQHRVQPWFPEVSADGEYARREWVTAATLSRAMRVVVGTQAGAAEVERYYAVPRSRIRVLAHPTPSFALDAATADASGDASLLRRFEVEEPFVVYPAALWPHKNHATALEAVAQLAVDGLTVRAVFPGVDKGQGAAIRARAHALGIASLVRLPGFVDRRELVALYRRAALMVYPSFFGPENLPPLEAFALGCPVVAADVDGSGEQLGDAALLVDPVDARAFAAAIAQVLQHPELRQTLVDRGRLRARQFTADDFAAGALTIIDEMARIRGTWGDAT
jgi:glycosyltransferase involved in cell wall biosynthesis